MIAVLDSGVGGVSVLRELVRQLPGEDFLYFGDNANAPYGTKSPETVRSLTIANAEMLFGEGADALVIACNTATGAAAAAVRERFPEHPVIGIEPALKPASLVGKHPAVLVMATPLTLRQEKYTALEARFEQSADITRLPCPGLMELVEAEHLDDGVLEELLRSLFAPLRDRRFDACVLGCTHYPHVKAAIARHLSPGCEILDGGEGTARETRRRMAAAGLLSGRKAGGAVFFRNSAGRPGSDRLAERLLSRP